MGWRIGSDRFLLDERRWKPRHYFQPTERVADAFRLLAAAAVDRYTISRDKLTYSAQVTVSGRIGQASASTEARAISLAVARAVGIEVEG